MSTDLRHRDTDEPVLGVDPARPLSADELARRHRQRVRIALLLGFAAVVAMAGAVAVLAAGGSTLLALVPAAAVACVIGAIVTLTRFEAFLLIVLASRAAIDSLQITHGFSLNAALSLVFIPIALVWIAGDMRGGRARTATTLPSLLLLSAALMSVVAADQRGTSLVETLRLASGLLMLELLQRFIKSRAQLVRLLSALALSLVVPVAAGLWQYRHHRGVDIGGFVRIDGTLRHPNPYSIFLVLVLLLLVAVFPHVSFGPRVLLALVIVPATAALMLTYTRSAYIGFALGIVIIGLLQSKKLLVGVIVLGVVVVLANPTVIARFSDLSASDPKASGATANSLVWRFQYWGETVKLAKDSPVTGIGLGMVQRTTAEAKQPHNDFVRTAAETGLLGFLGYVWLLVALAGTARRALRRAGPGLPRGVAVGFVAAATTVIVISVVSNVLSQVVLLWYVAAITGAAVGAARLLGDDDGSPAKVEV